MDFVLNRLLIICITINAFVYLFQCVCLFIYFIPLDFFFFRLFADILICLSYALHINPILFDIFVP